jgi:RimJ/RimL family protein N-acetyltransferase
VSSLDVYPVEHGDTGRPTRVTRYPWQATTERLDLRAISMGDLDDLYELNSDPRVWTHFPSGAHTSRDQTAAHIELESAGWERAGLGYWVARFKDDGTLAGAGGCALKKDRFWNLYYRFRPEAQGQGLASELVAAAREAAAATRPELPVAALLLEHNKASKALAEKSGLRLVWRGPDRGNPDLGAIRLVYADRDVTLADLFGDNA